MDVLFCVRSFLKRWRFLKSIHNSLFSASIFSISECSGCLLTGAVPGQAGALKYSSCCVSDQLVLTLVIVLYLIVSIFRVSSIILCYRYFDGDKYNKTIRRCLSRPQGVIFLPFWFFKVSGQSIIDLSSDDHSTSRNARRSGAGQGIMLSRSDDHSSPIIARRSETQPAASDSPTAFSSDDRTARRGLIVCP